MDSVFIRLAARGSRPAARVSSVGGRHSSGGVWRVELSNGAGKRS